MLAIVFKNRSIANKLVEEAMKDGLILFWLLWEKKAVRISPPLNITLKENEVSRLIITTTVSDTLLRQILRQINKLIDVLIAQEESK